MNVGIETADGMMSVVGFGSLLSQRSSQFTFPELQNFRLARLRGFRRVFAHITPFFFKACVLLYRVSAAAHVVCPHKEPLRAQR